MSKKNSDTLTEPKEHATSKLDLPETGVSAKKAEADLAASTDCPGPDVGQAGSVGVGCMGAEAPHLENEKFNAEKAEKCEKSDEKCEESPKAAAKADVKAEKCDKSDEKCEEKPKAEKAEKSEKSSKSEKSEKSGKAEESSKDDKAESKDKAPVIDLGVAGGLAILAVEQTAKAVQDVAKNWEDKVDAAALKAHETIESAQRAIKDPIGETLKQVEHLTHPVKHDKKDKKVS